MEFALGIGIGGGEAGEDRFDARGLGRRQASAGAGPFAARAFWVFVSAIGAL